jgi:hypothetical protein
MSLKSGHFNLFSILEFAANNPIMPNPGTKSLQSEYATLINRTVSKVPYLPGWYLWGRFNDMGWWETVYLGKAGKKKTSSLHTRLYDELREECIAFWSEVYGREPMVVQHKKLYGGKYNPTRSLRKSGSRMVIWVANEDSISEEDVKRQEDLLIKIYRPTHNAARWNLDISHDEMTTELERVIEEELNSIIRLV